MIQQQYKNNVTGTSGEVTSTGFSIEVNESMFQMLTSNVYNDPTLAVIREWSTNACDACIAANKEVKFDVHIPTLEESHFSVRDYGTGLAPEDIVGLFSNLGASTKRNSNAYNGTFGIGRMAGLAVSNAFTVESYYEGKHYSYAISMQNGVPVTLHLGSSDTDEPNGLKLTVNVDYDDINNYVNKASYLYPYFDHKPRVNRDDVVTELEIKDSLSDDWFIQSSDNHYSRTNYVVMSQVPYAIPDNSVINDQGFRNLVIKAPPGAVSFNPGRETLSLNKETVEYINKAFESIAADYVTAGIAALATTDNDFDLMKTYKALTNNSPRSVAEKINPDTFTSDCYKNLYATALYRGNGTPTFNYLGETDNFSNDTNGMLSLSYKHSYYKTSKRADSSNIISWTEFFNCAHVIVDVKTKYRTALNQYYSSDALITWQREKGADLDEAVTHAKRYLEELGIKYKLASDLIEQEEFVAKTAPREGLYASQINGYNVSKATKVEDAQITSSTYLYMKMKNTTPDLEDRGYTFEDYMAAYSLLARIDNSIPLIKGVAKKYQEYVDDLDNWVDAQTYIEEKMKESTFKIPAGDSLRSLTPRLITRENAHAYPEDIQDYFQTCREKQQYEKGDNYVYMDSYVEIAKKFGGTLEQYENTSDIDLDILKVKYPKAMPLLDGSEYAAYLSSDYVIYIAKLEEYYAIHSVE